MGLWPAGRWTIHAETQFGNSVNFRKTGAIMPPSYDVLLPTPNEGRTTLSEIFLTQPLSEKFIIIAGKLDGSRLADANAFTNSEKTQFLNAAFKADPGRHRYLSNSAFGAFQVFIFFRSGW